MRLIDADAYSEVMHKIRERIDEWGSKAETDGIKHRAEGSLAALVEAKLTLDKQPTVDAVHVVRCSSCKHWGEDDHGCNTILGKCGYTNQCTPSFQFCCFGERRREETE